jgi:hypothetical protein
MLPFPITTFDDTYQAYKKYYIAKNGSNKYEKIYEIIFNSNKIDFILKHSVSDQIAPTAADFFVQIHAIGYFIFAKNETKALGILIAMNLWNEKINKRYKFATDQEMDHKIKSVFRQLSMLY